MTSSRATWGTSAYVAGLRGPLVRVDLATGRASTLAGTAGRVELLDG